MPGCTLSANYFSKLIEKQKLKFNYILNEKQLRTYINLSYKNFTKNSIQFLVSFH